MIKTLLKLMSIVFICFFSFGLSIAVIPLYIQDTLHFNAFVIGTVIALQYLSTFASRGVAGNLADTIGAKKTLLRGLVLSLITGGMYFFCALSTQATLQLTYLALGRIILGIAESLIITGALTWALTKAGEPNTGKVMALNGNAMYGGVAMGAMCAGYLTRNYGFLSVAFLSSTLALISISLAQMLDDQPVTSGVRLAFYRVVHSIQLPGIALLLSTVGYALILSFITLLFNEQRWQHANTAITAFGIAYVFARLLFSSFPDRFGGARVALCSLIIECIGQACIWLSSTENIALLGALLTGFGFSLVVPGLGIEAIKRIPAQNKGAGMGAFLAFFDLSFCVILPITGQIVKHGSYHTVYCVGTLCTLLGCLITLKLLNTARNVHLSPVKEPT